MEIQKIFYTRHLSYWEKERNKKALNFINNSMPSYFEQNIKKSTFTNLDKYS
jgi:hypothetical protein